MRTMQEYFQQLERTCLTALEAVKHDRGPGGGLYVVRSRHDDTFSVWHSDDPGTLSDEVYVYAHVIPGKVIPTARSRYCLKHDGTVDLDYLKENPL